MKSHPLAAFYQWTVIVGTKSFMCTHKHTLTRLMDCDLLNVRRLIIASYECWASIIINNQLLFDVDCYHRSHVFVYLPFGTSSCCFSGSPTRRNGSTYDSTWVWNMDLNYSHECGTENCPITADRNRNFWWELKSGARYVANNPA